MNGNTVASNSTRPDIGVLYKDGTVRVFAVLKARNEAAKVAERHRRKIDRECLDATVHLNTFAAFVDRIFGK